jgi:hypothetical protein
MNDDSQPMAFNHGLTPEHDDEIDELRIEIGRVQYRIEALGRHRSYSLALAHLDEAKHWLVDRRSRPAA